MVRLHRQVATLITCGHGFHVLLSLLRMVFIQYQKNFKVSLSLDASSVASFNPPLPMGLTLALAPALLSTHCSARPRQVLHVFSG